MLMLPLVVDDTPLDSTLEASPQYGIGYTVRLPFTLDLTFNFLRFVFFGFEVVV